MKESHDPPALTDAEVEDLHDVLHDRVQEAFLAGQHLVARAPQRRHLHQLGAVDLGRGGWLAGWSCVKGRSIWSVHPGLPSNNDRPPATTYLNMAPMAWSSRVTAAR